MKKALLAMFSSIIILLFLLIFFTLYGYAVRYTEICNALEISMKQSISHLQFEEGVPVSEEEWINAFAESIAIQIESQSNLTVKIYEADMEKGLLSAEAILTFQNPIGTKTSVRTGKRTILLEKYIYEEWRNPT